MLLQEEREVGKIYVPCNESLELSSRLLGFVAQVSPPLAMTVEVFGILSRGVVAVKGSFEISTRGRGLNKSSLPPLSGVSKLLVKIGLFGSCVESSG